MVYCVVSFSGGLHQQSRNDQVKTNIVRTRSLYLLVELFLLYRQTKNESVKQASTMRTRSLYPLVELRMHYQCPQFEPYRRKLRRSPT